MTIDLKDLNSNQLNELIARARKRQEDLHTQNAATVRDKAIALIKAEGFTVEEIFGGAGGARKVRQKVKPKYSNPQDKSVTWSGRGKRPRWFVDALAAGKKEADLLIR